MRATMLSPVTVWSAIRADCSAVSGAVDRSTAPGTPVLPMSCRMAAYRSRRRSVSLSPMRPPTISAIPAISRQWSAVYPSLASTALARAVTVEK